MNDQPPSRCCAPAHAGEQPREVPATDGGGETDATPPAPERHRVEQAVVPAGGFAMGDAHRDGNRADGEDPVHPVRLDRFSIDANTYTRRAARGMSVNPFMPAAGNEPWVMRGGSLLCRDSYCNRYRNAARPPNTPDPSTASIGFRTVAR
jgi:formylglycine-generating enzyme required for sulfatase activity